MPTTFSAVFPGFEKDETPFIEAMVQQFNLKNERVYPNAVGFAADFDKLCYHQEEPFSSSSIYVQYKVFELAKQHGIKVLLDGQGADETLAGYTKYIHWYLQELTAKKQFMQSRQQRKALEQNGVVFNWGWRNWLAAFFPQQAAKQLEQQAFQLQKKAAIHPRFLEQYQSSALIQKPVVHTLNHILYSDTMHIGLEALLRYADRNSMAHGCEVRLPFLSHELVEFIFSLPASFKIKDGYTKNILRVSMQETLPADIVWRKNKIGFEPPQQQWMQAPIIQEQLLEAKNILIQQGILEPIALQKNTPAVAAYDAHNYNWRYLCAAAFFSNKK